MKSSKSWGFSEPPLRQLHSLPQLHTIHKYIILWFTVFSFYSFVILCSSCCKWLPFSFVSVIQLFQLICQSLICLVRHHKDRHSWQHHAQDPSAIIVISSFQLLFCNKLFYGFNFVNLTAKTFSNNIPRYSNILPHKTQDEGEWVN